MNIKVKQRRFILEGHDGRIGQFEGFLSWGS